MFCIAAFIVLAFISIFSASHREMTKKAWYCVIRRLTFKPCDINFSEELKGKILGKIIFKHPNLAKFLNKSFDWLAFIFVALSIWSLIAGSLAGLNLWVYDTCDPISGEACSLSGEACGISKQQLSFPQAISENRLLEYLTTPFTTLAETVSRVPDRLKNWPAQQYLAPTATFYKPESPDKPYAIEILDPSCLYCKKLYKNIKQTTFADTHNFSYILYPIRDTTTPTGYKFPHSKLIASYIEATKKIYPENPTSTLPADWQLLETIFNNEPEDIQSKFNAIYSDIQAEEKILEILQTIGYNDDQLKDLTNLAISPQIQSQLQTQAQIVEQQIKTIKIPTIIFNNRRYDRVITPETLQSN